MNGLKRWRWLHLLRIVSIVSLSLALAGSSSWGSEVLTQNIGDFTVSFSTEPTPPKKGKNVLKIALTGPDGKPVTNAQVTIRASMPGMEAMMGDVTAKATLKGTEYVAEADLTMEGRWQIRVTISRKGKPSPSATFALDVRR